MVFFNKIHTYLDYHSIIIRSSLDYHWTIWIIIDSIDLRFIIIDTLDYHQIIHIGHVSSQRLGHRLGLGGLNGLDGLAAEADRIN
jgi:hypothetical protein